MLGGPLNLKVLSYKSFVCLVRVTPRYFTLFEATVKRYYFPDSFSVHLSFLYKRAINFCELILYPATLLKYLSAVGVVQKNFQGHLCILSYHLQVKVI